MLLVIDNYDSFTYNLVQLLGSFRDDIRVVRNDAIDADGVRDLAPDYLVLSPGPGNPDQAGNLLEIIRGASPFIPTLGVCLGMQAIGQAYGGNVVHAPTLMHGKSSPVRHQGESILAGLPDPLEAGRYHSLVVDRATLPADLKPLAETEDGILMALAHVTHPVVGLQFHPESVLTPLGGQLLSNFITQFRPVEVL